MENRNQRQRGGSNLASQDLVNGMDPAKMQYVDTMSETDKKCPGCGGTMEFSPTEGKLLCPYCGTTKDIAVPAEDAKFEAKEMAFKPGSGKDEGSMDWGTATKTVRCQSCGAETIYDANAIANVCPYCGSTQVMEAGDAGHNIMAPGAVVVFQMDQENAASKFSAWINGKFFCPKQAKLSARPDHFQGLYIPYWTFDANTESQYRGEFGFYRTEKDKEGHTRTVTDWHPVPARGVIQLSFDDVLVCGSDRYENSTLRAIEPYDTKNVRPYRPEYLAGFVAERYSVTSQKAWPKAQKQMDDKIRSAADSDLRRRNRRRTDNKPVDVVRNLTVQTSYNDMTYKYILLPIWISSFKYQDKVYHFMVNGQTGKVSGETPTDWLKVFLVIAIVVAIIVLLFMMLGGDGSGGSEAARSWQAVLHMVLK